MKLTEAIDTLSGLSQSDQRNVEAINLAISILQNSFQPELKELDDVKHSLATQQVRAETAEVDVSNKQQEINNLDNEISQHLFTIEQKNTLISQYVKDKEDLAVSITEKENQISALTAQIEALTPVVEPLPEEIITP